MGGRVVIPFDGVLVPRLAFGHQALNKKEKAHFWAEGKAMQLEEILNIAMSEP